MNSLGQVSHNEIEPGVLKQMRRADDKPCLAGRGFNAKSHESGQMRIAWVKVFRIIPEFRILRMTFHRVILKMLN